MPLFWLDFSQNWNTLESIITAGERQVGDCVTVIGLCGVSLSVIYSNERVVTVVTVVSAAIMRLVHVVSTSLGGSRPDSLVAVERWGQVSNL